MATDDLGAPTSYLVLADGTPVYSSDDKELGKVEHVLSDEDADVFDGIVLDTSVLPGGQKFADASQVDRIYERGVVLTIDAAAAEQLPEPGKNPATMEVTGEDFVEREWDDEIEAKLKRAWDRISGKKPS
jgi:PRC-barrel domain